MSELNIHEKDEALKEVFPPAIGPDVGGRKTPGSDKENREEFIEDIIHEGLAYAIVIKGRLPRRGHNFVSDPQDSLQVGVNHYRPGDIVRRHFHRPIERALHDTLEVLHIDSGKCILVLFTNEKKEFSRTLLVEGDTVVLLNGGHGFEILDDTRLIEVKQGPYLGAEKDKEFF